ncbi:testis-expressed protein 52-like [Diadema setosum]|uniref:testis-expressed protein 52-like n=1 Tax=Diadema setosum TaxID=31175 RepID=UPI003B3AD8E0
MATAGTMVPYYSYFDNSSPPSRTLEEREFLFPIRSAHQTAFKPRQIQTKSFRLPPRSWTNIEINNKLRNSVPDSCRLEPSDAFRLWVEGGRREPPFPPRWDPDYNSNIWRNFSHGEGYKVDTPGRRVKETVAAMYPIKIPSHSEMKEHTFTKFLSEVPIIRDPKRRHLAISHSMKELQDFQRLKLRSEMRVPPMDAEGNLLPPQGFKRHPKLFQGQPHANITTKFRQMTEMEQESERSRLGTHRTSPNRLWKLSFKDNNPEFEQVQKDIESRKLSPKKRKDARSPAPAEILFK